MSAHRGLVRLLYNHNPFYLLSTCLMLYGAGLALGGAPAGAQSIGMVAGVLVGHVVLLALVGAAIVRWGGVWDDARSILLLILVQLTALSVCFDELLQQSPEQGALWLAAALVLAIVVTEGLLASLRLPFGPLWRVPYYLLLGLMFAGPLWIAPGWWGEEGAAWRVAAFPWPVAAAMLTLIPAVRRGRGQAERPGCPWRWPIYPWVVFGVLAACLAGRTYVLSLSFVVGAGWETVFAPYFLVPLWLACCWLVVERGVVTGRPDLQGVGLGLAWCAALLCGAPAGAYAAQFHTEVRLLVGEPLWVTAWLLAALHLLALSRGTWGAETGLVAALLVAATSHAPPVWLDLPAGAATPLLVLAVLELALAISHRSSPRFLAGSLGLALAAIVGANGLDPVTAREALLGGSIGAVLATGCCFRDSFARRMRLLGAGLLAAAPWLDLLHQGAVLGWGGLRPTPLVALVVTGALVGVVGWLRSAERWWLAPIASSGLSVAMGLAGAAHMPLAAALGPRAVLAMESGLAALVAGAVISAAKGASEERGVTSGG